MNFFVSEEALGGAGRSRREMRAEIAALCDKLDAEREKRDELLAALRRTDRGGSPCSATWGRTHEHRQRKKRRGHGRHADG